MNSNRSKTQKKGVTDLSGSNFAANLHASTNTFVNFLNQEADDAYKRPWHRLERGLRLNRLRKFVDEEALRLTLTPPEKAALDTQIMKANDKKLLNSKNAVIYDADEQKIKEIKGLVMHRGSDGKVLFQVLEKRNAVTFRKKQTMPTVAEVKEET
jgi:hypothetical protein